MEAEKVVNRLVYQDRRALGENQPLERKLAATRILKNTLFGTAGRSEGKGLKVNRFYPGVSIAHCG